jgi:hypothetical protein
MKGKQIVSPQHKRIRCETYTCKSMSGYSIGLKGFAPAYRNVCPACMDEIVRQAGVLLYGEGWTPEGGFASIGVTVTPAAEELSKTNAPGIPAGSLGEPVDALNGEDDIPEPMGGATTSTSPEEVEEDPLSDEPTMIVNEPAPPDDDKFYVCKDCGARFKKPSGKMEYVNHRRMCPKKQEAE